MYYGPGPRAFGHGGYGGSFGAADPETKVALDYTKTLLYTDQSTETVSKTKFIETVYGNLSHGRAGPGLKLYGSPTQWFSHTLAGANSARVPYEKFHASSV